MIASQLALFLAFLLGGLAGLLVPWFWFKRFRSAPSRALATGTAGAVPVPESAPPELNTAPGPQVQPPAAEAILDSIVENLPTMLFVKDAERLRFVRWNRAGEHIAGRTRAEFLGKSDYDFFPADQAEFFVAKDRETLAGGQVVDIPEEPLKTASGEIRWLHTKKFPVNDASGRPAFLVGISEDITERKRAETALQRQNAYLNALSDTVVGLMGRLDVNALLQDIVARAGALVGTENGYVFLREPGAAEMEMRVGVGAYAGFVGRRTQPGVGLAGQVWATNAPVVVDDYRTWGSRLADPSRDILRAVAGVPLRYSSEVVGVIGLAYLDEAHKFGEAEIEVLRRFAQLAAIALYNARLYETAQQELSDRARAEDETRARVQETATINELAAELSGELDAATVFATVEKYLPRLMPTDSFLVWLYDPATGLVTRPALYDRGAYYPDEDAPRPPSGRMAQVIATGAPVLVNHSAEEWEAEKKRTELILGSSEPSASLLFAPLRVAGQTRGVLSIQSYRLNAYGPEHVGLLTAVTNYVATALENARLFEQMQTALGQTQVALYQVKEAQSRLTLQYQTANMLAASRSLGEAVPRFLELVCAELNWQLGEYWEPDDVKERLHLTHLWHVDSEELAGFARDARGIVFARGEGLAGRTWADGRPLWVPDLQLDTSFRSTGMAHRAGLQSALSFPLVSESRLFGVTTFFSNQSRDRDETVLATMESLGSQIGQFLERRHAEEAMRQQNAYLTALHDTTLGLMRRLDVQELLENIIRRAAELVRTEHGYVHLAEPDASELRMRVGIGVYHDFVGTRVKPGQGLAGTVWQDGAPVVVDDYRKWPGRLPMVDRDVLRAVVGVPLRSGEETVGVLGLATLEDERRFTPAQVEALNRFAELAAVALDNARLYSAAQSALESTRRTAEREKASSEIADKLYAAPDVQAVLRTAAEELRRNTGSRRAVVRLNIATANGPAPVGGADGGNGAGTSTGGDEA